MTVYIYKNNQQLGPFEEAKVLEMLRNKQLLPDDLGVKEGQNDWQKLGVLFPNFSANRQHSPVAPNYNQLQSPPPQKGGSSKGLLFGLLGVGVIVFFTIVGLGGFFAWSSIKASSSKNSTTDQTSNSKSEPDSPILAPPALNEANLKALQNKAEEFVKMSPAQKLETKPVIKGKVLLVEKDQYDAKIKGFDYTGTKFYGLDIEKYGISKIRLATSVEEIETLIQVFCNKGTYVGRYEGNVSAYANTCKVSVIDYKNNAVVAQKSFTNSVPPKKISTVYKIEFILPMPNEVDDYIASFPLEKLAGPVVAFPPEDESGTYGKYKPFLELAGELARISYPVNINQNAGLKGKIAVALKNAQGRSELKGFDVFGKEIYSYDLEKWGVSKEKMAEKPEEIETLIQINCNKGDKIGAVRRTTVFSNKCEVSVVDYKTSTTIFQKSFENKEMEKDVDTDVYPSGYIVIYPMFEIEEFIKGFPKS